jgi:methylenetetrahydrofolate reductase (NADPH)
MKLPQSNLDSMSAGIDAGSVAHLARNASIELTCQDVKHLTAAREFLWPNQKVYISHLPRQSFAQTFEACRAVAKAGLEAVPHIPVRLLRNAQELDDILFRASGSGVRQLLLISGDYGVAAGPFSSVRDALLTGRLQAHGFRNVSFAGHPEGHPIVAKHEIYRTQLEKAFVAADVGIAANFVTQFFFEVEPFVHWAGELRAAGVKSQLVAGISGPANVATLLRFATRCGVGPSIRALRSRPSTVFKLLTEYRPERLLEKLADTWRRQPGIFDGIHLFCFGGFLSTAEWVRRLAEDHRGLDAHAAGTQGEELCGSNQR